MATTTDETAAAGVLLNFDSHSEKLAGWAAADRADLSDRALTLELMCGPVLLGSLRRDRPRPDVDAHLGYAGPPPGFVVPDHGLAAFARVCGLHEVALSAAFVGEPPVRQPLPAMDARSAAARPLASRHGIGDGVRLVDIWIEGTRNLHLRFEGAAQAPKSVDAYQRGPAGTLVKIAAQHPIAGQTSIVTIRLANPYAPLLLLFLGSDSSLDAIDSVPFPSLVRGGAHAAERLIAAHGGDDLADTATVSEGLLHAWLERIEQPERGVGLIELDAGVQTGLEPMLDEELLGWLGSFFEIAVSRPIGDEAQGAPDFIDQRLSAVQPDGPAAGHKLLLPADAIPTIAALVRLVPDGARSQSVTGGMGIIDPQRHGRIWSVWQPPVTHRFDDLQLAGHQRFAPILAISGSGQLHPVADEAAVDWPLALAMRSPPTRMVDNSPFETSPETGWPLRRAAPSSNVPIDVLILFDRQQSSPVPLLESLVRQVDVDIRRLVVCRSESEKSARVAASASRLFGDRFIAARAPVTAGRLEQIASASDLLGEDIVVVLEAGTIAADPRMAAVLAAMLNDRDVASAGCTLRQADDKMRAIVAGYSFSQVKLTGVPAVAFEAIDATIWRGPSTYPVVANSLAASAIRRQVLATATALGSSHLRPEADDLLLGLQAITAGNINLCTTIVSAYSSSARTRSTQLATSIPYRLPPERLLSVAESSTIVQRIA